MEMKAMTTMIKMKWKNVRVCSWGFWFELFDDAHAGDDDSAGGDCDGVDDMVDGISKHGHYVWK